MCYALKVHQIWFVLQSLLFLLLLLWNHHFGSLKPAEQWDWIDITAEGSSVVMCLLWLAFILSLREPGATTRCFAIGFICMSLSLAQDLIDEFIELNQHQNIANMFESLALGFVLIIYAFWKWREEQQGLTHYLIQRQKLNVNHPILSQGLTLPDFQFLKQNIQQASQKDSLEDQWLVVISLDPGQVLQAQLPCAQINKLTLFISELLLISVREQDLVCRYAGQSYMIWLPNTDETQAKRLTQTLHEQLNRYTFHVSNRQSLSFTWHVNLVPKSKSKYAKRSPEQLLKEAIDLISKQQRIPAAPLSTNPDSEITNAC